MALGHNASTSAMDGLVMCLDAQNLKSYSRNVHPKPKDLFIYLSERSTGNRNNCQVFRDTDIDPSPAGGIPVRMVPTNLDPHMSTWGAARWNLARANTNETWGISVYVKANTAINSELFVFGAREDGTGFSGGFIDLRNRSYGIDTTWRRVNTIISFTNTETKMIQVRLDGPTTANANNFIIWYDGLQVERLPANSTSVTEFVDSNGSGLGNDWIDVAGNNGRVNFTANTVYTNNSITFDGTNFADFNCSGLSSIATVEMWARTRNLTGRMFFGWLAYDVYSTGVGMGYNTGNSDIYGISSSTVSSLNLLNNWHHYVFEMTTTSSYTNNKIYIDGQLQTLSQQTGFEKTASLSFNNGVGRIAGWRSSNTQYLMPMDCNMFKIYNRALTQEEITRNYNAHKGRFGL